MVTASSLLVKFISAATAPPGEEWWLTVTQQAGDDRATIEEAAKIVDALYDIDPCLAPSPAPAAEPTEDKLQAVMAEVDLEQCRLLMSGDYETALTIVKSHPDLPYKLTLSVGVVKSTVIEQFATSQTLNVKAASAVVLPLPVLAGLTASWQGVVYGPNGPIDPPALQLAHNTIYWSGPATGTIRADYQSQQEIVTVTIPGVKDYVEDLRGEPQSSQALLFYHYQTYSATIAAPVRDDQWEAELAAICGRGPESNWGRLDDDDEDQEPEPPPEPEDPCLDKYYETGLVCCGTKEAPDCLRWHSGQVQGVALTAAIMAKYPGAEFIALPTDPAKGCGQLYGEYRLTMDCCSQFEPLAPAPANPEYIGSNSAVILSVLGGATVLRWTAYGGLYFKDGDTPVHQIDTLARWVTVFSSEEFCQSAGVKIVDGCSELTITLPHPPYEPLLITNGELLVVAPDSYLTIQHSGIVGPYQYSSPELVSLGGGLFYVPEEACGAATVYVSDGCAQFTSAQVKITVGKWETVGPEAGQQCVPVTEWNTAGSELVFQSLYSDRFVYRALTNVLDIGSEVRTNTLNPGAPCDVCPCGTDHGSLVKPCNYPFEGTLVEGYCLRDGNDPIGMAEYLAYVKIWVCP